MRLFHSRQFISILLGTSYLCLILGWTQCNVGEDLPFKLLSSAQTGIDFQNTIIESDSLNILDFHYIYNGGGIGVADFNKDNYPDLVFSGNQVASRIYLNQKDLSFKDITQESNFVPNTWVTGIAIVDINEDGWQDIYLSVGGYPCETGCKNQLYIHQGLDANGIPQFLEMADQYGLSDSLYNQQALFFDYDLDGDLDVYLVRNAIDRRDKNAPSNKQFLHPKSQDQLLRNNGKDHEAKGFLVQFSNVSDSLGIVHRGYGLGIALEDFNKDGFPDLYIANDFLSDDLCYLNLGNRDGKHLGFQEVGKELFKHTSYNSMGVDVADVNNDTLADILVLDMMPATNERQKTMLGFMNYNKFELSLRQGYNPQFIRNTLQLNNGFVSTHNSPFSEVGYLTGLYKTDWSWTPLLADFDNDGDRDIYITNGYGKDVTDLDFINYRNEAFAFETKESLKEKLLETLEQMAPIKLRNYIFENTNSLHFEDRSDSWMKTPPSISNGAIYADLDLDGDLDLISNNLDQAAFILENRSSQRLDHHYFKVELIGPTPNPSGIGSRVYIWANDQIQYAYQAPVRGYLSSVEHTLHFGLGTQSKIDSILVIWPNGKATKQFDIPANQTLSIHQTKAVELDFSNHVVSKTLFQQHVDDSPILHEENPFSDFDGQHLLLHQHSRQGPCLEAGRLDNRSGEAFFVGGSKGISSKIYHQTQDGLLISTVLPDSTSEDTDALFFDFDQDDDLDLYVVSGGSEFSPNNDAFQDRLYLNDGSGHFEKRTDLLPEITASGSCVTSADFDQDGDLDLFVGGRIVPKSYPQSPQSYLLLNEEGKFVDRSSPLLQHIGMITDAYWSDFDQDGWVDLIVVGEWMPITIFKNQAGQLAQNPIIIEHSYGLWNCIKAGDLDGDGDEDFIIGNLGLNSRLQASPTKPLVIFRRDFDQNGSIDPIVGQYYANSKGEKELYPIHARDDIIKQLPMLKKRYIKYAAFGSATFPELLETELNAKDQLFVTELRSIILMNEGSGQFTIKPLPKLAQLAPVQAIHIQDFNQDNTVDIVLIGNDYSAETSGGWHDAFNGLVLLGSSSGVFEPVSPSKSGFLVPGDGRDLAIWHNSVGDPILLASQNKGPLLQFKVLKSIQRPSS